MKRVKEVGGSCKPIQQGIRAWKGAGVKGVVGDHAAFPKAKAVGVKGVHLRPIRLSLILRSGYLRKFGGG